MDRNEYIRELRNGAVAMQGRLQEFVRSGMPSVGWEGDPNLWLELDRLNDRWMIVDHEVSPPDVVAQWNIRGIADLDMSVVCKFLKDAKVGDGESAVDRALAATAKVEEDAAKTQSEYTSYVADELLAAARMDYAR